MRRSSDSTGAGEVLPSDHPLWALDGRQLGPYRLELVDVRQLRSSGWKGFRLALLADDHRGRPNVLQGIHSVGGKGVSPWFDVEYRRRVSFDASTAKRPPAGGTADRSSPRGDGESGPGADAGSGDAPGFEDDGPPVLDLREADLEVPLLRSLRELVPANGHLMVAYEDPQHRESHQGLKVGVPAVATPLGWAAWRAGFDGGFKNWHISEGGHEGPKKLQANVPLDRAHRRRAAARALSECRALLEGPAGGATAGTNAAGGHEDEAPIGSITDPAAPSELPGFWRRTRRRVESAIEALEEQLDEPEV